MYFTTIKKMFINSKQSLKNCRCQHLRRSCTHILNAILARGVLYRICIFVTFCKFIHIAQTRRLQPCEFAGQLYILDVPKVELPLWSCIAEYESRFNTDAIGKRNLDGSYDYGIFQISDKFWCQPQNKSKDLFYSANECNINCSELLSDDITQSVRCALIILKQQGWSAWSVYEEFCNETSMNFHDLEHCFTYGITVSF